MAHDCAKDSLGLRKASLAAATREPPPGQDPRTDEAYIVLSNTNEALPTYC